MTKKLLLLLGIITSQILNGQISIVFISNNDSLSVYNCVNELSKNKQFKQLNFRVVHFNDNNNSKEIRIFNKLSVDVRNEKIGCDFNFFSNLNSILKSDFSKRLLLYSKNPISYNFKDVNIEEIVINSSFSNEFISEKISQQITNFKKNSKSVTLYFNFNNELNEKKNPSISSSQNLYSVKKGEVLKLNLQTSTDYKSINWIPEEGLSCTDCLTPELTADKAVKLKAYYLDNNGCQSNTIEIDINVMDDCDQSKKLIIPFGKINFSNFKQVEGEDYQYDIMPIGVGGGFKYDLPTTRNCATDFKLIIKDLNNNIIVSFVKKREEIDENANFQFVNDNPDFFVFRINLQPYYKQIQSGATITIESYDEKGTNYKSYTSPVVSFSGCK